MKNVKKVLAWMLLAAMPVAGVSAEASPVACAAKPLEIADFECYPSNAVDEATGRWTVHGIRADALLDRFWSYKAANGDALCAFHLELEGSAQTGIWTPVLRFYYANGKTLNATAVSLLVGDVRYDMAASSEEVSNGQYTAQRVSAPLTREALAAVEAMIAGDDVSVRLIGDVIYTAELDRDATGTRKRIEAASLNTLEEDLALLETAGLSEYGLWDLSADAWESQYGYAPAFASSAVETTLRDQKTGDDFGMVKRNDQTKAARAAQEILVESGFMSGSVSNTFTKGAADAARRAQKYLGLIVTGCVDAQLERALLAGRQQGGAATRELSALGDVAEVALDRYWFADGVSAASASESIRTVFNGDNVYLASDGWIRNVSAKELQLFMQMEARVIYNGAYAYEATLVCECDDGRKLDTLLLPMAQARLLVYAEIPAYLAQDAGASWSIELSAGDAALEFELQ